MSIMKNKIIVSLVIIGMVFSGISIDFESLNAEGETLTITNKGNSYDYPTTAIAGQPYTVTVRWTQNYNAHVTVIVYFTDEGKNIPWNYIKTFKPGFSVGSHSHTFTVTAPNDGRMLWDATLTVTGTLDEEGKGIGDRYYYTIQVEQPLNPPKLNVTWHVPDQFEYEKSNPLWFEICNKGGGASGESELWISGYSLGHPSWYLNSGDCTSTGWRDDFYVSEKYIQDGYVTIRFWAKVTNDSGTDTYDETKKIPVIGMEGSIKVIVKDDSGDRLRDAKIYLDGSYEGKTNSSGEYTISNLAPNEYKVEASKSGYEDNSEYVYLEAGKTVTVYLTLEEIPPTTTTPKPTTPKPTTPKPTTPSPTTPRPTTPSPTTPPPTKPPCDRDSDNDGVPDCEDECEDTPPDYYVDRKGCRVCLKHDVACDVKLASFLPYVDKLPQIIILINDWCRVKEAFELDMPWFEKVDRVAAFLQDLILMPAHIIAAYLNAQIVTYLLQMVVYIQDDCGNPFADEIGAGKEFFEDIYEDVSQKIAEENIDAITVFVGSPAKLVIKDEKGNILSEENYMGIPGGFFYKHNDYKFAFVVNPEGKYEIKTIGTGKGTYDLKIKTIKNGEITKSKEYDDVQTSEGKIDTYKVHTASDGDNDIEESTALLFVGFILSLGFALFLIGIRYKGF